MLNGVKVLRIVFMGTPEFAVPSLDMLVKEGYTVAAVITQPDKPKGRGNKVSLPPVKEYALGTGIPVLQPSKIKTQEFVSELKDLKPDLLITAAYGKILSKEILDTPPLGCINVHGSLLPKYRGAAPIHWAIINGENVTGITTMFTDIGLDTGDMLLKKEIEIPDDMTVQELHDKMAVLGAEVLKETIQSLQKGTLKRVKQQDKDATYAPIIKKEIGHIDWTRSSKQIYDLVRGTNPWPGAYSYYQGDRMRIWKTALCQEENKCFKPGTISEVTKEGILVAAGDRFIRILEVQFDSCRKMCVGDYICGHSINEGEILG
ncbi:MAG: methionyl-tRNA formyltransferase [Clostridia bacterium]|nr:methionyl-tRNA formyltransferase [Clostridia bacterium]